MTSLESKVKPERVQLRRTKGWRMPPNTVKVTRGPGMKWGNPFKVVDDRWPIGCYVLDTRTDTAISGALESVEAARSIAVSRFRRYARSLPVEQLRGKNLACFCPLDQPCHADILLELANQ
jgi:hypothetical protein